MNSAIDRTESGNVSRPKAPAPLMPVAIGLSAGILLDQQFIVPFPACAVAVLIGSAVVAVARGKPAVAACGVVLAAIGVGAVRHALFDRRLPDHHIARYGDAEPTLVRLRGRITTPPRIVEPDPSVPRAYSRGPRTVFQLEALALDGAGGPIDVCGPVQFSVKEPMLTLSVGDEVQGTGWLFRPRGPQNPGQYDWSLHQRRMGVRAGFSCDHAEGVRLSRAEGASKGGRWLAAVRRYFRGLLIDDVLDEDEQAAGVMAAMVLGQRSAVTKAMNEAFVRSGNAHFLAASGMHVAWLALLFYGVCRAIGLHHRLTALIVAMAIVSYVLIAEPRPSILRAGIMGVALCMSAFVRGRYGSPNALSLAVVIILLIRPADLFSPAFQFSFVATLGLIFLCPVVSTRIMMGFHYLGYVSAAAGFDMRSTESWLLFDSRRGLRTIATSVYGVVAKLFALSISQWLITAPLACYAFNNLAPWGWLGSFVVWFVAMPAVLLGYVTVLVRLAFPSAAALLSPLVNGATDAMIACVNLVGRLPGSLIDGRSPSIYWVAATYAALALWVFRRRWMPLRHGFVILAIVLVGMWAIPPRWVRAERGAMVVWTLAVGDGTGTVIELPDGRVVIYDFGTRSAFDAGPVAESFLRHRGITRIDAIFVSHANFDHYGAVEHIVGRFEVGRLVVNDHFRRFAPEGSAAAHFLASVESAGVPIEVVSGPKSFDGFGDVSVEQIWPPSASDRKILDANDTSTVLKVASQGESILLTGDIAELAMAELLTAHRETLRSGVLALPHHGSVVFNTEAFIEAVSPAVAIRSTGQRRAMTTSGIERIVAPRRYFSTADDGCAKVTFRESGIIAEAFAVND
jgi:competence protein ComEC